jgi:hypothetical protein
VTVMRRVLTAAVVIANAIGSTADQAAPPIPLEPLVSASPVAADGVMDVRGSRTLFAIGRRLPPP